MMKPYAFLLALLCLLPPWAGALKMSIWDREMQTTFGAGESSGNKFNVQLVKNYSGPVVVLFSQTEEEKRAGTFQGLQNRYEGVLKDGTLTLMPLQKSSVPESRSGPFTSPTSGTGTQAASVGVTLLKLLQPYKLNVIVQTTNQSVDPPSTASRPIITETFPSITVKNAGGSKDVPAELKSK